MTSKLCDIVQDPETLFWYIDSEDGQETDYITRTEAAEAAIRTGFKIVRFFPHDEDKRQ